MGNIWEVEKMAFVEKRKKGYRVRYTLQSKILTYGTYPNKRLADIAKSKCEIELAEKELNLIDKDFFIIDFFEKFNVHHRNIKESTAKRYNLCMRTFLAFFEIKQIEMLSKITLDVIQDFIDFRLQTVKTKTVNHDLCYIKQVINYAIDLDYLKKNPLQKLKLLKIRDEKKMPCLTSEQISKILSGIDEKDKWFKDVFIIALYSGMRAGELLFLTWDCIDLDKNCINIKVSKTEPRTIPMHPKVREILLFLHHEKQEYQIKDSIVIRGYFREPVKRQSIRGRFRCYTKKAGFPEITQFHALRHTFITHFANFAKSTELTRFISGHKTLSSFQRYSHDAFFEDKQALMNDFEY